MFTVTRRILVEWAHCDPAGIIFNPHYYIWMDGGTHTLLQAAGFDFIEQSRGDSGFLGCPLVASNMAFKRPLYFGDVTTMVSRVEKFGNTSFVVAHAFHRDGEAQALASGSEVRVWGYSDPDEPHKLIAKPVPEAVRAMLSLDRTVDVSV
jgi:4-hydroxybenzoyl-CoA thioesterase